MTDRGSTSPNTRTSHFQALGQSSRLCCSAIQVMPLAERSASRIKAAWRLSFHGLAALLSTSWDTQLSPVDTRRLSASQLRRDPVGRYFQVSRAKTGRAAIGTLTHRTQRVIEAYITQLPAQPVGHTPLFRNRSGAPYSKDTLGDDFRTVRTAVFGESETRQLADFRRSGSIEAMAGDVSPQKLSVRWPTRCRHPIACTRPTRGCSSHRCATPMRPVEEVDRSCA